MPSITRTPACPTKWCPQRTSPEFHVCAICEATAVEHHHLQGRGMGGSPARRKDPENVICLCHKHHEMVTTGGYSIAWLGEGFVMKRKGEAYA